MSDAFNDLCARFGPSGSLRSGYHDRPSSGRHGVIEDLWVRSRAALESGEAFVFWEDNPWNPGTRYVGSQESRSCAACFTPFQ